MAENELCVLLSNVGVKKDKDFLAWWKKNQGVEVVSVDDAGSKLEEKKPTKLTLILTKYVTIEKPGNPWSKFKETLKFPPLITLHFIFLVEEPETLLLLGINEFFENLQFETIEFDFKSSMSINSTSYNLPPDIKNNGIRVNLSSKTRAVTIRGPDAPIIQLRNDDSAKFSLQQINLFTKSYSMAIILYNVNPNVIMDKKLKVYWKGNESETLHLEKCEFAKDSRITYILLDKKSTQPAFLDCSINCCFGVECDV
jgi:hypothetical protein